MNKTAIEWTDYTWNPVTGCLHGCPYCYARKIAERFKGSKAWPQGFAPMIHPERFKEPRKLGTKWNCPEYMAEGSTIFVCSMADLFGEWVPDTWINQIFEEILKSPRHTFIFLTKNPKRYLTIPGSYLSQKNFWFGATVTDQASANQRIHWLQRLPEGNTFVSFEPILAESLTLDLRGIKQVILGAQTNPTITPPDKVIGNITFAAYRAGAQVFFKDSLQKEEKCRQELAWNLNKQKAIT